MCDRCEELQEEVRQLWEMLAPTSEIVPAEWELTRSERQIFLVLKGRGGKIVPRHVLHAARNAHDHAADVDIKIVDIHICKLRRKLRMAKAAWQIVTHWGEGFSIRPLEPANV